MQKRIPSNILRYLLLEQMDAEPTYGYAIVRALEEMSKQHWTVSYGTVYGALGRLQKRGYARQLPIDERGRKYFELTAKGREQLEKQRAEIGTLGDSSQDIVLGYLNVYKHIYGERKLARLLARIRDGFTETIAAYEVAEDGVGDGVGVDIEVAGEDAGEGAGDDEDVDEDEDDKDEVEVEVT